MHNEHTGRILDAPADPSGPFSKMRGLVRRKAGRKGPALAMLLRFTALASRPLGAVRVLLTLYMDSAFMAWSAHCMASRALLMASKCLLVSSRAEEVREGRCRDTCRRSSCCPEPRKRAPSDVKMHINASPQNLTTSPPWELMILIAFSKKTERELESFSVPAAPSFPRLSASLLRGGGLEWESERER